MSTSRSCDASRLRAKGMTLIEVLVSLVVVTTIVGYVIPGFQTSIANGRQTSTVNRFVASVLLARSLAVTQPHEVILCPSIDGATCHDENDWNRGWIVQQMIGSLSGDGPASARLVHAASGPERITLMSNRTLFRFRPRGRRATNGTMIVCVPLASHPKAVIVSYNGRPRTSRVLASGEAIECPPS